MADVVQDGNHPVSVHVIGLYIWIPAFRCRGVISRMSSPLHRFPFAVSETEPRSCEVTLRAGKVSTQAAGQKREEGGFPHGRNWLSSVAGRVWRITGKGVATTHDCREWGIYENGRICCGRGHRDRPRATLQGHRRPLLGRELRPLSKDRHRGEQAGVVLLMGGA
jgi:hypothetical protein